MQLDGHSPLLDQARRDWPGWREANPRLRVVEEWDDLRAWLEVTPPWESDPVLLTLAMLAAPDGGDDVAAAAALSKCLLPGAVRVARWLSTLPASPAGHQPVCHGQGHDLYRIDELVAAELWIQVRSFPWRRLHRVAANIIRHTRSAVQVQLGHRHHVARTDRTWAMTEPSEALASDASIPFGLETDSMLFAERSNRSWCDAVGAAPVGGLPLRIDIEEPSPVEELLEVLQWGCDRHVITVEDRHLLLCLVVEAEQLEAGHFIRRSDCGGLLSTELSRRVAARVGVGEATVRRHAARSIRALAAAAPQMLATGA